jgi:hypothetical protein
VVHCMPTGVFHSGGVRVWISRSFGLADCGAEQKESNNECVTPSNHSHSIGPDRDTAMIPDEFVAPLCDDAVDKGGAPSPITVGSRRKEDG